MRNRVFIATFVGLLLILASPGIAAEQQEAKTESKAQARADLQVLVGKIQGKINEGKRSETDLAGEIKEFDALLAKYKDQKTDDVAKILLMKAMLYLQMFENVAKGEALIGQLKTEFPGTAPAQQGEDMLASLKIKNGMAIGAKFPDFDEKDLAGKPLSVANYKGKVVLVDFWATWCGPCVGELPNVLKAYEKYHQKGFEILGVSLDSDKAKLTAFIEKQKMPWQQYFDGKGWGNKLAGKYGVSSIPATYLLDGEGKIIAKNLRGEALEVELAKILEKH